MLSLEENSSGTTSLNSNSIISSTSTSNTAANNNTASILQSNSTGAWPIPSNFIFSKVIDCFFKQFND